MKQKIVLIVAIIIEILFVAILPYSINDKLISISPSFFLAMLIISQRKNGLWDNFITCIVFTTVYSILMNLPIFETNLIYILLFLISKIWSRSILDSILEMTVLGVSVVFVKEVIVQVIRYFIYSKKVNFLDVLGYRIAPTMLFMIFAIFIMVIIYQIISNHYKVKQEMGRQHEKIKVFKYFNK